MDVSLLNLPLEYNTEQNRPVGECASWRGEIKSDVTQESWSLKCSEPLDGVMGRGEFLYRLCGIVEYANYQSDTRDVYLTGETFKARVVDNETVVITVHVTYQSRESMSANYGGSGASGATNEL